MWTFVIFPGFRAENGEDCISVRSPGLRSDRRRQLCMLIFHEYFPKSRIMVVGYAAMNVILPEEMGMAEVMEHLAVSIIELAEVGKTRPVLLVGHDEGLVLKSISIKADEMSVNMGQVDGDLTICPYKTFLKSVRAIFFRLSPDCDGNTTTLQQEDLSVSSFNKDFQEETERGVFEHLRTSYQWITAAAVITKNEGTKKVRSPNILWQSRQPGVCAAEGEGHLRVSSGFVALIGPCSTKDLKNLYYDSGTTTWKPRLGTTTWKPRLGSTTSKHEATTSTTTSKPLAIVRYSLPEPVDPDILRRDIVALGINSFEYPFNRGQIICLYESTVDFVKLIFFHPEGMAQVLGVGLPFSVAFLSLDPNRDVEVRETGEETWKLFWTRDDRHWQLAIFDRGNAGEEISQRLTPRNWINSLVQLLGMEPIRNVQKPRMLGMEPIRNVQKPGMLGMEPIRNVQKPGMLNSLMRWLRIGPIRKMEKPSMSNSPTDSLHSKGENKKTPGPEAASSSSGTSRLELTTRVVLLSSKKIPVLEASKQQGTSGGCWKWSAVADDDQTPVRPCTYGLGAEIVIAFSSGVNDSGIRSYDPKTFTSTVEARFDMPEEDKEEGQRHFGWYHNNIHVSFECAKEGAVRKTTSSHEVEVLTSHRLGDVQRGVIVENSETREKQLTGGATIGVSAPITGQVHMLGTIANTQGKKTTLEIRDDMKVPKLDNGNFQINYHGTNHKLSYCFEHTPPPESYNFWDNPLDRQILSHSVMTSLPIAVRAGWMVENWSEAVERGTCSYKFSCQRKLFRHRKITFEKRFPIRSKKDEVTIEKRTHQIERKLRINHSFLHIQRLKMPVESYDEPPEIRSASGSVFHCRKIRY
ncbi:hypothetical protein R1sor_022273 [Riccia sorocarpa]|uniref:Uncharacterized protein n=1 Tax=Riccia sorocarpa TaxID=122646 RepID=A0ABD3GLB9_9MARC